jgi:ABC-type uncharacterized transport system substrate-binding protein
VRAKICLCAAGSYSSYHSYRRGAATQTIGYLAPVFPCSGTVPSLEAFREGLHKHGYVEGRNIAIECRSAAGNADRLSDLAAELVRLKVDVIISGGGELVAPCG